MQVRSKETLAEIVDEYSKLADFFEHRKKWNEMTERELWEELCLCILSSNVPYELALSAFWHLRNRQLLDLEWITGYPNADKEISYELAKQIYMPKKKDGSYRKYRFPNVRARNIDKAAKILYREKRGLIWALKNSSSEEEARTFLSKNVSGIGLKEASHFLRNIGFSRSLAIIDSHVIAFLTEVGVISHREIKTVTPDIYMELERNLRDLCKSLSLDLSIFDMAIWQNMRGKIE